MTANFNEALPAFSTRTFIDFLTGYLQKSTFVAKAKLGHQAGKGLPDRDGDCESLARAEEPALTYRSILKPIFRVT